MIPGFDTKPLLERHADEVRLMWQARVLAETKGKLQAVVLAVLMHTYTEAMPVLLRIVFPGFRDIRFPFFSSGATIVKSGKVAASLTESRFTNPRLVAVYETEEAMVKEFRDLADRLKLNDADRVALTAALKRWVVADLRVDHMGRRVA